MGAAEPALAELVPALREPLVHDRLPDRGDQTWRSLAREAVFITNAVLCNPRTAAGRNAPPTTADSLREFGVAVDASIPGYQVLKVHPTQLYEVARGMIMFAVLFVCERPR